MLRSGRTGTVHVEQVLEYNQDPTYLRDLLLYRLTLEAQKRVAESPLSKREIVRRLGTSAAQLYRLLDQTNYRSLSIRCWPCCRCSTVTLTWWCGRRPPDEDLSRSWNRGPTGLNATRLKTCPFNTAGTVT